MRHTVALFGILGATWFLWSGHLETMLLGFGLASVAATVWLAARLDVADEEGVPLSVLRPGLFSYVPWLLWQLVLSNLDVARRVWSRDPALDPRLVTVVPTQRSFVGRVLYANSITLTPGTVSLRMYDGEITVHALHQGAADDLLTGEMDRRVTALEGRD